MKGLLSNLRSRFSEFLQSVNGETDSSPLTVGDMKQLYTEYRSFTGYLPYAEYLDDAEMVLLDDHVSVAAVWEIEPIRTEGLDESDINLIEQQITKTLAGLLERDSRHGRYVLSFYTMDTPSLGQLYEMIEAQIHPRWKDSVLASEYLASTKLMLQGMESEEGLFRETMMAGDSEASTRAYRGGKRKHYAMLYRRPPMKDRKGTDQRRDKEIEELTKLRSVFEATVSAQSGIQRVNREGFYELMVRLLNPAPLASGGNVNRLLKENPCPSRELASVDEDYVASMLHSRIVTKNDSGVIEFDGMPGRFLQVERINTIPDPGMLTAEKMSMRGKVSAAFDDLPPGAVFVQHITFEDIDEMKAYVGTMEERSRHNDDEAALTNEQCIRAKGEIAQGNRLYKLDMGVFLFAANQKLLDEQTERAKVTLTNDMGLRAVTPENNLFPIESFIRNLPLVYDPVLDTRRRRGKINWWHHIVRFIPLTGRTRGHVSRTRKICHTFFNRRGEAILYDPLDYDGNAHGALLGPSGMGKSATLNKMIVELLLFKNARIVIAEAGESFDPLLDFLEAEGQDVQRVNIGEGLNGKPVAPLANAKKARDDLLLQLCSDPQSLEREVTRMASVLATQEIAFDAAVTAVRNRIESVKAKKAEEIAETSEKQESKDSLGECRMLAQLLVTGGDPREEAKWVRRDDALLVDAVVDAANIADFLGQNIVTPSHLQLALEGASKTTEESEIKKRCVDMAYQVSLYTKGVRGKIFDQQCETFRRCDCLHVELGLAQKKSNEDMLALAYLSLMNMINDMAESKARDNDVRPIFVFTDEAHLILKDPKIAPIAVLIVRTWRKYGTWFIAATQDFAQSFIGEAKAILGIAEIFYAIKPPKDDLEVLCELAKIDPGGTQAKVISRAKSEQRKFTEMAIVNKTRGELVMVRIVQPSFTLALAGTDDKEKNERQSIMNEYGLRTAGAVLVQAARIDKVRSLIDDAEYAQRLSEIRENSKYQKPRLAA